MHTNGESSSSSAEHNLSIVFGDHKTKGGTIPVAGKEQKGPYWPARTWLAIAT